MRQAARRVPTGCCGADFMGRTIGFGRPDHELLLGPGHVVDNVLELRAKKVNDNRHT